MLELEGQVREACDALTEERRGLGVRPVCESDPPSFDGALPGETVHDVVERVLYCRTLCGTCPLEVFCRRQADEDAEAYGVYAGELYGAWTDELIIMEAQEALAGPERERVA